MSFRFVRKNLLSKGFSIVEMMIVLSVAGTIMAATFMAFPAIQRNSRNGQRRNDVQAMLQAVSQYELNNSGNFPDSSSIAVTSLLQYSKLSFYSASDVTLTSGTKTAQGTITDISKVYIYNYQKCDPVMLGFSTSVGTDYTNSVALYAVEGGGAIGIAQCSSL
jgi:prepilin-type N-terminal cleavage/methylation domain-containing protein